MSVPVTLPRRGTCRAGQELDAAADELLDEPVLDGVESFFDSLDEDDDESELLLAVDGLVVDDLPRLSVL